MFKVKASGWPWQLVNPHWASNLDRTTGEKWGWNPFTVKGMGRFGGGWAFKFGVTISKTGRDICLDLGIGGLRIQWVKK